jgi:hypothetical protein
MKIRLRWLCLAAVLISFSLKAQNAFEFWPGTRYDPAVPSYAKVFGHEPGERILSHADLLRYLDALAAASPRIRIHEYGKSWEGKRLVYAAVGSEANVRRLDEIRADIQRLSDPRRTPQSEASRIITGLPAVIWLGYGVHGNEISSPEAALVTAYHLLAARDDKLVDEILSNVVVLIDPIQNPDGRDRFVHSFEQTRGSEPDENPTAAEHMEPWPGGRGNHYSFDLNRDWISITQPETKGRIKMMLEWLPLVVTDLHEMDSDATYYFAPEAVPYNPHLTKWQRESLDLFGRNNAKWFDTFGFNYFTREVFDAFYPGYGASWPAYHGAVAMTYECGSPRGLLIRRSDETILHLRDAIHRHFVASVSTAETASRNRARLLEEFFRHRQTAIEEGQREQVREYVLPRRGNTSAVDKLACLLAEQGAEVKRAAAAFKSGGQEYPAGSYVIPLAQPAKRLLRTLLDPQVPMEESFIKEQERRRTKKLPDEIYDVTAWSLPLLYNVEAVPVRETSAGNFEPVEPGAPPAGAVSGDKAAVAYLAPWGTTGAAKLLATALQDGLRVLSADKPFVHSGRSYPSGTLIIRTKDNPADLDGRIRKMAAASGADVVAAGSSWVDEGISFGSSEVVTVRRPSIALAWDLPASSESAGWTRFVLERQFGYPVTVIRTRQLLYSDLSRFNVLILPDPAGRSGAGGYASVLGEDAPRGLREWAARGGTLIALGGAVSYLADPKVGLLPISQENLARTPDPAKKQDELPPAAKPAGASANEPRVPGKLLATEEDYRKAIQADSELPDRAPGAVVRARIDSDHWLGAGLPPIVNAVVEGTAIFTPAKLDKGVNVAVFLGPDQLFASGYLWEETRKQLAYKPLVVFKTEGRGSIIGFTADPNFRAFLDGLNVLFLNAVFRGPAHALVGGSEVED